MNFSFWVFVAISGSEKYSFELFFSDVCSVFLYFFGLEILMPGIFLGLKFQACVFFWVCNVKLRRTPPVMYTSSTPPGDWPFRLILCTCLVDSLLPLECLLGSWRFSEFPTVKQKNLASCAQILANPTSLVAFKS